MFVRDSSVEQGARKSSGTDRPTLGSSLTRRDLEEEEGRGCELSLFGKIKQKPAACGCACKRSLRRGLLRSVRSYCSVVRDVFFSLVAGAVLARVRVRIINEG